MYLSPKLDRLRQGDVFKNITFKDAYNSTNDVTHSFCIVLSQDCDLEQNFYARKEYDKSQLPGYKVEEGKKKPDNDKYLATVLVIPAFTGSILRNGEHLLQSNLTMQHLNSAQWGEVKINNNPRYHYLKPGEDFKLTDLVLDFKRFYTLPLHYLEGMEANKVAQIHDFHVQNVAQRYSSFLSRVALPDDRELVELDKVLA